MKAVDNRTLRNKFYFNTSIVFLLGLMWCMYNRLVPAGSRLAWLKCPFKQITHLPCPGCGTTRGMLALIHGDISKTVLCYNALCVVELPVLVLTAIWLAFDITTGRNGLYHTWARLNVCINRRWTLVAVVSVIGLNWMWNILKGL